VASIGRSKGCICGDRTISDYIGSLDTVRVGYDRFSNEKVNNPHIQNLWSQQYVGSSTVHKSQTLGNLLPDQRRFVKVRVSGRCSNPHIDIEVKCLSTKGNVS
jgi:hypothetical protein